MIVTCEHCGARYKLDPSRITGRGVRITCPRCKNVFAVYRQQAEDDPGEVDAPAASSAAPAERPADPGTPSPAARRPAPPRPAAASSASSAAAAAAAPAPRPDIGELDFTTVGIQAWKVKVAIGLVYDFSDYKTLARYIKDGRVGESDRISHDGKTWTVLGEIDDLEEHFFQVYERARREQEAGQGDSAAEAFDDESPTMIVGASALAGALGEVAAAGGGGGRAKPRPPVDDDDSGHVDLAAALNEAADAEDDELVIGSGGSGPVGPRFQDPFARARAERQSPAGASRRRKAAAAAAAAPKPGSSRKSLMAVVAVGGLLGAVAVGGWVAYSNQQQRELVKSQELQRQQDAMLQAQKEKIQQQVLETKEQKVQDEILRGMDVVEDDPYAVKDDEDVLIPVGGPSGRTASTGSRTTQTVVNDAGTMTTSRTTPSDHYDAGRSALGSGDYGSAVMAFRNAVSGDPGNGTYREYLGLALWKSGDLSNAARELRDATTRGSVNAYKYLGDIAAAQGDDAGAIGYWRQYLSHRPNDAGVQSKIDGLTQ